MTLDEAELLARFGELVRLRPLPVGEAALVVAVGCPGLDVAAISGLVRLLSLGRVELRTRRV